MNWQVIVQRQIFTHDSIFPFHVSTFWSTSTCFGSTLASFGPHKQNLKSYEALDDRVFIAWSYEETSLEMHFKKGGILILHVSKIY